MATHFASFNVTSQVFYRTSLSYALVNLKPLVPGHVLCCPHRRVARVRDLTGSELADLFQAAQRVSNMIQRVFDASAVNIAIQDGEAAGQTVPHVHAHIIPRRKDDFDGEGDKVYELLESKEGDIGRSLRTTHERSSSGFPKVDEESRKPRSDAEMNREAVWLAKEMQDET
ncbi:MAG: hypothetical protein M1815_001783 [Lichina confinis]|nr:MAG: hypothetical protein M1815_001783 [Lichina confinis]